MRASGVTRSLGGGRGAMLTCTSCGRTLPRDAIAMISRKRKDGKRSIACGECYRPGGRWWTGEDPDDPTDETATVA